MIMLLSDYHTDHAAEGRTGTYAIQPYHPITGSVGARDAGIFVNNPETPYGSWAVMGSRVCW